MISRLLLGWLCFSGFWCISTGDVAPTPVDPVNAMSRCDFEDDQYSQIRYNRAMRTVNISDLKAQLSAHIQFVKDGEEVLVCDRNKPVARIVPCGLRDRSEQEQRLIARGVLLPPLKKRTGSVWPQPPGDISDTVIEQVWREERENR